jgi:hypothetical protein
MRTLAGAGAVVQPPIPRSSDRAPLIVELLLQAKEREGGAASPTPALTTLLELGYSVAALQESDPRWRATDVLNALATTPLSLADASTLVGAYVRAGLLDEIATAPLAPPHVPVRHIRQGGGRGGEGGRGSATARLAPHSWI